MHIVTTPNKKIKFITISSKLLIFKALGLHNVAIKVQILQKTIIQVKFCILSIKDSQMIFGKLFFKKANKLKKTNIQQEITFDIREMVDSPMVILLIVIRCVYPFCLKYLIKSP
jgi:hypothetical protein